jgi:hypothetical protein
VYFKIQHSWLPAQHSLEYTYDSGVHAPTTHNYGSRYDGEPNHALFLDHVVSTTAHLPMESGRRTSNLTRACRRDTHAEERIHSPSRRLPDCVELDRKPLRAPSMRVQSLPAVSLTKKDVVLLDVSGFPKPPSPLAWFVHVTVEA